MSVYTHLLELGDNFGVSAVSHLMCLRDGTQVIKLDRKHLYLVLSLPSHLTRPVLN